MELWEGARYDGGPGFGGKAQHEADVVDASQSIIQLFFGPCKVMYVGGAVIAAGVTVAALFNGPPCGAEARRLDVDAPAAGEEAAVTGYPRGQNAVEHVHAEANACHEIFGRTYSQ